MIRYRNTIQTNVNQYFCYVESITVCKKKNSFTIANCKRY